MKTGTSGLQRRGIEVETLFVYGTLKSGYSRNNVLSSSELIGLSTTKPQYTLVNLTSFPGLLATGNSSVHGELYRVSKEVLSYCDFIEGHPDFYQRKKINLFNDEKVWGYILDAIDYGNYPVIESGIWE